MRCGSLLRRRTTRSGRSVSAIPPGAIAGRGRGYRLALPAVCAETALHLKTTASSGELCIEQFFPTDGAASLEAGSDYRRCTDALCTPGMRLLATLSGARTVLHIQDYEVDAMLGLGMAGKGKRGSVARLAICL